MIDRAATRQQQKIPIGNNDIGKFGSLKGF